MSRVSLVRGNDRYSNVKRSLELLKKEISKGVKDKKRILIKPNFVTVYRQFEAAAGFCFKKTEKIRFQRFCFSKTECGRLDTLPSSRLVEPVFSF